MSTSAQLAAVVSYRNDSDSIAVLFAEEGRSASLCSILRRHHFSSDIQEVADLVVDHLFNACDLFCSHSLEMAEVKSETILCNRRTCLLYMISENFLESLVQQMRCSMICRSPVSLNCYRHSFDAVAYLEHSAEHRYLVHESLAHFLDFEDLQRTVIVVHVSFVTCLTAAFRIERSLVEDDHAGLAFFGTAERLLVMEYGLDCAESHQRVVSCEFSLFTVYESVRRFIPSCAFHCLLYVRTFFLLCHRSFEPFDIH